MKTYTYELCESRHTKNMEGIFPKRIECVRSDLLEKRADERIPKDCGRLEIYVTGFAMAMLAVVKVCARRGIHLTAYHYSPEYHLYTRQEVM